MSHQPHVLPQARPRSQQNTKWLVMMTCTQRHQGSQTHSPPRPGGLRSEACGRLTQIPTYEDDVGPPGRADPHPDSPTAGPWQEALQTPESWPLPELSSAFWVWPRPSSPAALRKPLPSHSERATGQRDTDLLHHLLTHTGHRGKKRQRAGDGADTRPVVPVTWAHL